MAHEIQRVKKAPIQNSILAGIGDGETGKGLVAWELGINGIPPAKWEKCEQMVGLSFFNRAKTCETRRFTRVSIGMKLEKL